MTTKRLSRDDLVKVVAEQLSLVGEAQSFAAYERAGDAVEAAFAKWALSEIHSSPPDDEWSRWDWRPECRQREEGSIATFMKDNGLVT